MVTSEMRADIEAIEQNAALYDEIRYGSRAAAIDYIEFHILNRIEGLAQSHIPPEELTLLGLHAERVKRQLEAVDASLFHRLRSDIRANGPTRTALRDLIGTYFGHDSSGRRQQDQAGYDSLDMFINGLLGIRSVPLETRAREPGMVYYQQTPARIMLELVEKAQLTREDVFYDLGSGLGHVPILVGLLREAAASGIEFEPAYCAVARRCAAGLNLSRVAFINADARAADYSDGAVFFLYTPFEGRVLQEVLEKLRAVSQRRGISLFTYGPCTPHVARQPWLERVGQPGDPIYRLGEFRSR